MPYVSTTHKRCYGVLIGNGQCVALVRECGGLPHTSAWRRGNLVRGADCAPGTCIAAFDADGRYGNHTDGRSHAAILIAEHSDGLLVADQWVADKRHPVAERVIRFRGGQGNAANDGDRFHTIELSEDG